LNNEPIIIPRLHARIATELILRFADNGIGAEIGIREGKTSFCILDNTQTRKLYMIDPWVKLHKCYSHSAECERDYNFVKSEVDRRFKDRAVIIRDKSENVVNQIQEELDFIFIDGNHDYEYVMKDLTLYVPKMKRGSLVMGHDWCSSYLGVVGALTDYYHLYPQFFSPPFSDVELKELKLNHPHVLAPGIAPFLNKSCPKGRVWWFFKNAQISSVK
jgi:hypothetical protein